MKCVVDSAHSFLSVSAATIDWFKAGCLIQAGSSASFQGIFKTRTEGEKLVSLKGFGRGCELGGWGDYQVLHHEQKVGLEK